GRLVAVEPPAASMTPDPTARTGRRAAPSKKRLKKSSGERSPGRPPLRSGIAGPSVLRLVLMFTTAGFASLLRRTQSGARIGALWAAGRSVHSGVLDALVKPKWGKSPTSAATAASMTMGATQRRRLRVNFIVRSASLVGWSLITRSSHRGVVLARQL